MERAGMKRNVLKISENELLSNAGNRFFLFTISTRRRVAVEFHLIKAMRRENHAIDAMRWKSVCGWKKSRTACTRSRNVKQSLVYWQSSESKSRVMMRDSMLAHH